MSDLYNRIVSERGSFERLLARIPGIRGYVEKGARRESNDMLRDYIATQLSQRVNRLAQIERTLLDNGGLGYMSKTQSAKTKLQTFRDRVKTAAPGYSGFMAAVKIDDEALERIYAFDEAMIRYVDQLDDALNTLQTAVDSSDGINEAIAALDAITIEANEAFTLRDDVLTNIGSTL